MRLLVAISLAFCSLAAHAQSTSTQWRITQPTWTERHERQFGEFVAGIGQAVEKRQCGKVDSCMKSVANPYIKADPAGLKYYSDCADLPYYLRSYFAWKNGLPMSIVSEVKARESSGMFNKDLRYNSGNVVVKRYDVVAKSSFIKTSFPNALEILNETIPSLTYSATYRMPGADAELFSDFYPSKLDRNGIRPGTVIYDPNGHVAIVYKVTDDGRVFYIDAHPDNSLTMGMFTPKFVRSNPGQGAGFKNFRPLTVVGASQDSSGAYVGGKIVGTANTQLPGYSTEQFYGTQPDAGGVWSKGQFVLNGQSVNFYEYTRMKLSTGDMRIDPLVDMAQLTEDICVSLKDRVAAVDESRTKGISSKPHPAKLPLNIYGTDGEWESYSTPSRDARLKVSFMDLLAQTKSNIERFNKRDPSINYAGGNLAGDLLSVYAQKAQECQFSYTTTNGKTVTMNLEAARQRLFNMSFDPYHCVEKRWGARTPEELAGCTDDANKNAWYEAQRWLRYQSERRYDARMDYSLSDLTGPKPGAGVEAAPDVDIVGYLKALR